MRASEWKLRTTTLQFGERPLLMGILNVTPDSFSDGGDYFSPSQAAERALRMEDDGADILDIGGESTRPYSEPVDESEELRRIEPVLAAIADRVSIPISIDTTKSAIAKVALDLGAEIINDISGLEKDPSMAPLAAASKAGICAMHMQGSPQDMQDDPKYDDVVEDVFTYLIARRDQLLRAGIEAERICLDPGIGFGKTHEHNIELIRNSQRFFATSHPILVGHSRKGFIGKLIGDKSEPRAIGSVAISLLLAQQKVHVLRVHDVKETKQALDCFEGLGALTSRLDP
ncbi:MAG: dihydropteroate synthase [Pirellulaceae bacterium]